MKKTLLITLFAVFGFMAAFTQTTVLTGQVVSDSSNLPLPGVSVVVAGMCQGKQYDNGDDGKFSFTSPEHRSG